MVAIMLVFTRQKPLANQCEYNSNAAVLSLELSGSHYCHCQATEAVNYPPNHPQRTPLLSYFPLP